MRRRALVQRNNMVLRGGGVRRIGRTLSLRRRAPRRHHAPARETFDPAHELSGAYNKARPGPVGKETKEDAWPDFLKPVYVVSIRRWRMDHFVKRMGPWMAHMKRAPCVDGRFLSLEHLRRTGKLATQLGAGQVGCAQSHIEVWSRIANGPYAQGTVIEDDIAISYAERKRVLTRVRAAIAELKASQTPWELLWWVHGPWAERGNPRAGNMRHWRRVGCQKCPGFVMYTMKKSLAQKLLKSVYPLRHAIDVGIFHAVQRNAIKALLLYPKLSFVLSSHPSETTKLQP